MHVLEMRDCAAVKFAAGTMRKGKGDTEHVPKASSWTCYSLAALLSYCKSELS